MKKNDIRLRNGTGNDYSFEFLLGKRVVFSIVVPDVTIWAVEKMLGRRKSVKLNMEDMDELFTLCDDDIRYNGYGKGDILAAKVGIVESIREIYGFYSDTYELRVRRLSRVPSSGS